MKYFLTTFILVFNLITLAQAEHASHLEFNNEVVKAQGSFDLSFQSAFLLGEFKQFYQKQTIPGAGLTMLFPVNKSQRFHIGMELGYLVMSYVKPTYNFNDTWGETFEVKTKTFNSMIPLHIVSRLYTTKPLNSKFQLYMEALVGVRMIILDKKVNVHQAITDKHVHSETITSTTASWGCGAGVGAKLKISKGDMLYLNAKACYLLGTPTTYQNPELMRVYEEGNHEYESFTSRTDILRLSLGIYLLLN
ncbi:MAG: hypothetical protein COB15_14170 [Flavobacteriales bacterium]|nr:MAG: hypothetical protein COB15_14170 [Flavobacteriales bacterium]